MAGEAGNRKIQKPQISIGKVQVREMSTNKMNNMLCIGYDDKELAKLFCNLVDGTWKNVNYICFQQTVRKSTVYWVLLNLTFNVQYKTLQTKFGKCTTKSIYCFTKRIKPDEWNDFEETETNFKQLIENQVLAEVSIQNFETCLEEEQRQLQYRTQKFDQKDTCKKRKFDD